MVFDPWTLIFNDTTSESHQFCHPACGEIRRVGGPAADLSYGNVMGVSVATPRNPGRVLLKERGSRFDVVNSVANPGVAWLVRHGLCVSDRNRLRPRLMPGPI